MKKTYQQPEIWVEELEMEIPLLESLRDVQGKSGNETIFGYGGGGIGPARAGESNLWEDEEDDSGWNQL